MHVFTQTIRAYVESAADHFELEASDVDRLYDLMVVDVHLQKRWVYVTNYTAGWSRFTEAWAEGLDVFSAKRVLDPDVSWEMMRRCFRRLYFADKASETSA